MQKIVRNWKLNMENICNPFATDKYVWMYVLYYDVIAY